MKSLDAKSVRLAGTILLTSAIACFAQTAGQKMPDDRSAAKLVGTWRGASTCMVKDSPCQDEINVYHISAVAGKADTFSILGSKIVEGREVVMGTTEWTYYPASRLLASETPAGRFILTLQHDGSLEGGLLRKDRKIAAPIPCDPMPCSDLPDSELYYRRIHLKKVR